MKSAQAQREFERHLSKRGLEISRLTPGAGLDAMLSFYRDVRTDDADPEGQGDMLLYQWGAYNWGGQGKRFELDITRQLVTGEGEDDDIWQLHLTFRFEPTAELQALGAGNRWCQSPDELDEFTRFVVAHPAKVAVENRSDASVELLYEQAG